MFARPRPAKLSRQQNLCEVEHTFTKIVGPAISNSNLAAKPAMTPGKTSSLNTSTTATTTTSSFGTVRTNRTGDSSSFSFNANDTVYLEKRMSQRGYRILSYKENRNGTRIVFDILDGTVYNCGTGAGKKITYNAVVFDSKRSALSERFPSNQVGGSTRSGNGVYPRVLVAFDGWGQCRRRLGGGPSTMYEFVKFMGIVDFLDPPYPVPRRQCTKYVEPHFFTPPDTRLPNRSVSERVIKVDRSFDARKYEPSLF